ncbi:MAG: dTMP kinase [Bacteroidales bacterium]|nr:dTMP kinase [Bacteroidales bacterium]
MKNTNRFIVLEGLDGSGKSTQVELFQDYLKYNKIPFRYLHFPRTDSPVYGELVAMFLQGKFGALDKVDPYLVALLYAGDRMDASEMIRSWLAEGLLVLVDRYVFSNIAFQCAKLTNKDEQEKLRKWILHLEYAYHKIPSPDLNILLTVPFAFTEVNLTQRRSGSDRDYLDGADDIHEADLEFQKRVREAYLWQLKLEPSFIGIDCADENGQILNKTTIHNKIIHELNNHL